ncbi:MAG: M20/M25/M40 family metallo-hydrolase [Myxococcota bacterium]
MRIPSAVALALATLRSSAFAAEANGQPDYDRVCGEARAMLEELVAIDTTNPPGHETKVAQNVYRRFQAARIDATLLESSPGRGNVIARVPGDGSKRPLLLLAHIDVVGAGPRELWSADPFRLTAKDGYLYGRGVGDDKGMAAAATAIALDLRRRKLPLARDVVVALTADEESGGDAGIVWLLRTHRDLIDADFALNEGAGARLDESGKLQYVGLQTAEKIYQTYFLETEAPGGHSSVPLRENAILRLAAALDRLGRFEFPARLTGTTRAHFAGLADYAQPDEAKAMRAVAAATGKLPDAAVRKLSENPTWNAQLRTTCVATMIEGGSRENALAQTAKATVN